MLEQNNNAKNIIKEFCNAVKNDFDDNFKIQYEYDKEDDFWYIWHNYKEFDNIDFRKKVGKNIIKYFFSNNLVNTSFAYNSCFDESISNVSDSLSISNLETEYINQEIAENDIQIHGGVCNYIEDQDSNFHIICNEQEMINSSSNGIKFCSPQEDYMNCDLFRNKTNIEEVPAA